MTEVKKSNLVLPTSGYELDREEMCYVEGGGKIVLSVVYTYGAGGLAVIGADLAYIIGVKIAIAAAASGILIAPVVLAAGAFLVGVIINAIIYHSGKAMGAQEIIRQTLAKGWLVPNFTVRLAF